MVARAARRIWAAWVVARASVTPRADGAGIRATDASGNRLVLTSRRAPVTRVSGYRGRTGRGSHWSVVAKCKGSPEHIGFQTWTRRFPAAIFQFKVNSGFQSNHFHHFPQALKPKRKKYGLFNYLPIVRQASFRHPKGL